MVRVVVEFEAGPTSALGVADEEGSNMRMKRYQVAAVAAALVGVLAFPAPASAERPVPTEPTGNMSRVTSFGADECFDLEERVVQVPTGEKVLYHTGWAEDTEEFLDLFLFFVDFEVERNGVLQPSFEPQVLGFIPDQDLWAANFDFLIKPGRPNVPEEWTVRFVVNENDPDFEGFVIGEWTREIVWTPRGQFPSDTYPCTTGQDPCEQAWSVARASLADPPLFTTQPLVNQVDRRVPHHRLIRT